MPIAQPDASPPHAGDQPPRRHTCRIAGAAVVVLAALVVVANWTWGRLPAEPPRSGNVAQLGDVRVRYVERPGDGTPIVLIHGLPGTAEDFAKVTPLLAGHRTIALDRPGYGYSDGGYFPVARQLRAFDELLDHLKIDKAVLVGHSYGGTLALGYAALYPERVQGLVLVAAAAGGMRSDFAGRAQARMVQFLSLPIVEPLAHATFSQAMLTASAKSGAAEAFDPDPVQPAYEQRLLASSMRGEDLDAFAGEHLASDGVIADVDRQLPRIAIPSIVIQGDGDRSVAEKYGRRIADGLPNARYVPLTGGHMVPLVRPDVVAEAARECARRCEVGRR
ncbi:MAG: alpha/beta hydrolase [Patulibacter sp.]|nr:alpha/beta hydrolase [Patulibacter sp.]